MYVCVSGLGCAGAGAGAGVGGLGNGVMDAWMTKSKMLGTVSSY